MMKVIVYSNPEFSKDYTIEVLENEKTIHDIHITPDNPPDDTEMLILISLLQNAKEYTLKRVFF